MDLFPSSISEWFSDQFDEKAELAEISFNEVLEVNDLCIAVSCYECDELIAVFSTCKFCNSKN